MPAHVHRQTIDLSGYPDLVVIYLGLRVNTLNGIKTALGFGPQIDASVAAKPHGLLLHERIFYSFYPPNIGTRQYWRDMDSLVAWTRSEPHRTWGTKFLKDTGAPASGTRLTACAAAWRPSTTTSPTPSASPASPRTSTPAVRVTPPCNAPDAAQAPNILQLFQNLISTSTNPCLTL
jgi:Domain of unknown function (DUF4188)